VFSPENTLTKFAKVRGANFWANLTSLARSTNFTAKQLHFCGAKTSLTEKQEQKGKSLLLLLFFLFLISRVSDGARQAPLF
jgi:hypothetical protein